MSCDHRDQHIDLLGDDLPAAEASALRAKIEACPHCAVDFAVLEGIHLAARGLLVDPPESMDAVILAAAQKKIEKTQTQPSPGLWGRLGAWLDQLTLGPQVAMASVMFLVVAVGAWYSPNRTEPPLTGATVVANDPDSVAVPSPTNQPLMEEVDESEERVDDERINDESQLDPTQPPADTPEREVPADVAQNNRESSVFETERHQETARQMEDSLVLGGQHAAVDTLVEDAENGMDGLSTGVRDHSLSMEAERTFANETTRPVHAPRRHPRETTVASALPSSDDGRDDEFDESETAGNFRNAHTPPPAASRPSRARPSPTEPSAAAPVAQEVSDDRTSTNRTTNREAQEELPATGAVAQQMSVSVSRTLLTLAHNHRAANACAQAVQHYDELLRRFPSSPEVPTALMEGGDCHRRLGRVGQAEQWFRRALRFAGTRAAATRELRRIESSRLRTVDGEAGEAPGAAEAEAVMESF